MKHSMRILLVAALAFPALAGSGDRAVREHLEGRNLCAKDRFTDARVHDTMDGYVTHLGIGTWPVMPGARLVLADVDVNTDGYVILDFNSPSLPTDDRVQVTMRSPKFEQVELQLDEVDAALGEVVGECLWVAKADAGRGISSR